MSIKTRIAKLEQQHRPQDEITISLYYDRGDHIECNGQRFTREEWAARAATTHRITLDWGDTPPSVLIPDNGRS